MKSARMKRLIVLSLVLSLSGIGCGGVEKKPTPESLTKTKFETLIEEGCKPIPLTTRWECEDAPLMEAGELGIRLQERVTSLEEDMKYYEQKLELKEDFYQAKLDQWFRRWYVVLPIGFAIGLASGVVLMLF